MKSTTLEKFLATLCAALLIGILAKPAQVEYVQTCKAPAERNAVVPYLNGDNTTLAWLQKIYPILNESYFDNKLPKDVKIDMLETEPNYMASTTCEDDGTGCTIHFNYKYVISPRHAELVMLHEGCHIATYNEHVWGADGQEVMHGPRWRTCMLKVDIQGANRYILIDGYRPMEAKLAAQ